MGNSWDNKATSPQFTTGVTTDSATISVFNTTATTGNLFGAANTINIGSSTATINLPGSSINFTNATSAFVSFGVGGAGVPTFTTRSSGTKSVFYQTLTSSAVDYARGIAASTLWDSIPQANSSYNYKLYGGTTEVFQIRGDGLVTLSGDLATSKTTQSLFNTTATTANVFGAASTLNLAHSVTGGQTINIGTGTTSTGNAKSINIGTGGASGSITSVTLGSIAGSSTTTINGSLLVGIQGAGYTPSAYATAGCNITWNKSANGSGATYIQNFRQGGGGGFNFELYNVNAALIATPLSIAGAGDAIDASPGGHSDYRRLRLGGGNSSGYLFGSFAGLGDGIHLGYNVYYNTAGTAVYPVNFYSTMISVGYAAVDVKASTGYSSAPTTVSSFSADVLQTLTANSTTWGGLRFSGTYTQDSGGGGGSGAQYGIYSTPTFSPTATINNAAAGYFGPVINAASTKTITSARSLFVQLGINSGAGGTGTVTQAISAEFSGPSKTNGTLTTGYALYATVGSGATNNYSFYFDAVGGIGANPVSGVSVAIGGTAPIRIASVGSGSGTTAIIDSNGDIKKLTSSIRTKKNVVNSKIDSALVFELRPVEYDYKSTGQHDFGLIAEEVEKSYPILLNYDSKGKPESVKYDRISLLLLSELKKSNVRITKLEKQIKELKK